ncbi:MAG: hypothetical protein ACO1OB_19390, partial [Archangium sp.]
LGDAPGTCGFTATASAALDNVRLMAKPPEDITDVMDVAERTPDTILLSLGMSRREVTATGVPCGDWTVVAMVNGEYVSTPVSLRSASERVTLPMPVPSETPARDDAP